MRWAWPRGWRSTSSRRALWAAAAVVLVVCLLIAARFPDVGKVPGGTGLRQMFAPLGRLALTPVFWLSVVAAASGIAPYLLWQ